MVWTSYKSHCFLNNYLLFRKQKENFFYQTVGRLSVSFHLRQFGQLRTTAEYGWIGLGERESGIEMRGGIPTRGRVMERVRPGRQRGGTKQMTGVGRRQTVWAIERINILLPPKEQHCISVVHASSAQRCTLNLDGCWDLIQCCQ